MSENSEQMTEPEKVFIDTAPFIYFLDEDVNFGEAARAIFQNYLDKSVQMCTSVITIEEYLIVPYRTNNTEKEQAFFEFLSDCNIRSYTISEGIAKRAAEIRAEFPGFKAMDSLQLAAAELYGADTFLTNDKQLTQFRNLKISLISKDE